MKQEKFNELMKTGEFEQMFIENRINELLESDDLTKEQIDSLIQLGKDISKTELERRQKDLASQPGYEEYILSPLVAKILGTKTKKTKSVPEKTVEQTKKMKEHLVHAREYDEDACLPLWIGKVSTDHPTSRIKEVGTDPMDT